MTGTTSYTQIFFMTKVSYSSINRKTRWTLCTRKYITSFIQVKTVTQTLKRLNANVQCQQGTASNPRYSSSVYAQRHRESNLQTVACKHYRTMNVPKNHTLQVKKTKTAFRLFEQLYWPSVPLIHLLALPVMHLCSLNFNMNIELNGHHEQESFTNIPTRTYSSM